MYNYFLFNTADKYHDNSYRFTCRETLIRQYSYRYPADNFYFGHVAFQYANLKEIKNIYKTLCDEVWKGNVPYEIIELKDIEDCECRSYFYHLELYPNNPLIKIPNNINPLDISLILLLSWYGKIPSIGLQEKQYFITKKYSDLIPNFYDDTNSPQYLGQISGNGPRKYIDMLERADLILYNRISKLYPTYNVEEFKTNNRINSDSIYGEEKVYDEDYDEDDNEDNNDDEENN